jgi:hypothetical protein
MFIKYNTSIKPGEQLLFHGKLMSPSVEMNQQQVNLAHDSTHLTRTLPLRGIVEGSYGVGCFFMSEVPL